jgi:D-alanine-D-alanine ligase
MRVLILHSAVSAAAAADDLDTLAQVEAVAAALAELGHESPRLAFDLDAKSAAARLSAAAPDAVFNLVETVAGSARFIALAPALLEHLRLPFTGAGSLAMMVSSNKLGAKAVMAAADLPTPAWCDARGPGPAGFVPGRYLVKSVWEHASKGLSSELIVDARESDAVLALIERQRAKDGGEWFAEAFVDGREFAVTVLDGPGDVGGPEVLAPAEMQFLGGGAPEERILDYAAKWDEGSAAYRNTVRTFDLPASDAGLAAALEDAALRAWRAFGLAGYARVDFRVDEAGRPLIIDVNANPCLTPDAGFAAAAARAGLSYPQLITRILDPALASPSR